MALLQVPDRLVSLGVRWRDLLHDILHGSTIHGFVEVPAMAWLLGIPSGARVLVLGCGSGVALVSLARLCKPYRITGIDIDRSLLCEAAQRMSSEGIDGELVQSDIRTMPFPRPVFQCSGRFRHLLPCRRDATGFEGSCAGPGHGRNVRPRDSGGAIHGAPDHGQPEAALGRSALAGFGTWSGAVGPQA